MLMLKCLLVLLCASFVLSQDPHKATLCTNFKVRNNATVRTNETCCTAYNVTEGEFSCTSSLANTTLFLFPSDLESCETEMYTNYTGYNNYTDTTYSRLAGSCVDWKNNTFGTSYAMAIQTNRNSTHNSTNAGIFSMNVTLHSSHSLHESVYDDRFGR